MSDTIEVFISYSKQDKELRDGLLAHLRPLETKGIISWYDRQILPGTEWDSEIKARLNAADIILLLISADFLATDYCTQVEIPEALRRHNAGETIVMPVILRSCAWDFTPLAAIQAYPEKAKPIKSWTDIDEAYTDVVRGVYLAATRIQERRSQQQADQEQIQRQQKPVNQPKPSPDALRGDYAQLESLLKAGKWKEADQETAKQMCQVMGRQQEGYLLPEDIEQFPCDDLRTIDQLWIRHSQGKFGFSVQKEIWQRCGSPKEYNNKQWDKFGVEVGWVSKGFMGMGASGWKSYDDFHFKTSIPTLTFNISAPTGHLPALGCVGGFGMYLFFRATTCKL